MAVDAATAVFMADERVKFDLNIHPFPWKCKDIVGSLAEMGRHRFPVRFQSRATQNFRPRRHAQDPGDFRR